MNTLVVYFPDNKRVDTIVKVIASDLKADIVEINAVVNSIVLNKLKFKLGCGSSIYPLNVNLLNYDNIVIVSQVIGKHISPVLYTFIREYSFRSKNLYCVLCFNRDAEKAKKSVLNEFEEINIKCKAIVKIKTDDNTINALKERKVYLTFDSNNKLSLCHSIN